ncbi:phosphoglycerate dehydrogenase [Chloroflexota bacterium]
MIPRILVSDIIAQEGIDLLKQHAQVDVRPGITKDELKRILPEYDALIVRSEPQITADVIEAGTRLLVVGRAGIGVDNIDLDTATRLGIAVVNAPTSNTVAVAEHTMGLMLALARHIPQANATLGKGEWKRNSLLGVEMQNKTLGIIGLGHVGSEVARRVGALNMRLLAYDPFVSQDYAWNLRVELTSLGELCQHSDFITLHTPLNDSTRGLIGQGELRMMKPGVLVINAARGGIIDEAALLRGLEEGHVAGAALDVFVEEPPGDSPLVQHPKVIVTPHLGGSTAEAQQAVAREVAWEVLAILDGRHAKSTVNLPFLPSDVQAAVDPYLETTTILGKLAIQLVEGPLSSLDIWYPVYWRAGQSRRLHAQSSGAGGHPWPHIRGFVSKERPNLANTGVMAAQRDMHISETKDATPGPNAFMVTLEARGESGTITLGGMRIQNEVHILWVNEYRLDIVPSTPYLLFIDHQDRPGMIGALGKLTGNHNVNIAFMAVGRQAPLGKAMMVIGLDDPVPEAVMREIRAIPHITSAKLSKL